MNDIQLVQRMRSGDERAFDEFFGAYFPRLFHFAVRRLGNEDAAEDVVQAALIIATRKIGTWRGEAALFTWLCTICRHELSAYPHRKELTTALLSGVTLSGGTSLYDSVYQALQKVKEGRYQKKAVLLVTDGEDTTSTTRFDKALQDVRESEMLVYSVGIKGAPGFDLETDPLSGNARPAGNFTTVDMKVLNQFGEASGGRAWEINEASFGKKMDEVLETLAAELRSQYSIGYYPNRPVKDGKWHRVRIRMKNPDYSARARKEYLDK